MAGSSSATTDLFSLPTELRVQIYKYLIPESRIFNSSDTAHPPPAVSFWRTSRQIHDEASETFYGTGTFEIDVRGRNTQEYSDYINFLGRKVELGDIAGTEWLSVCKRIKHLHIRMHAHSHEQSVCEAQGTLYGVVRRLGNRHVLRTLKVSVDVTTPALAEPSIKPQDLSPDKVIGFVTTPLHTIRLSKRAAERRLIITVTGDEGQPLDGIAADVSESINNRKPVCDFRPVLSYINIAKELFVLAANPPFGPTVRRVRLKDNLRGICNACIDGRANYFREYHTAIKVTLGNLAERQNRDRRPWTRPLWLKLLKNMQALNGASQEVLAVLDADDASCEAEEHQEGQQGSDTSRTQLPDAGDSWELGGKCGRVEFDD